MKDVSINVLKQIQPIGFTILFLLIFSGVIYYEDKILSEKKLESSMELLGVDIENYLRDELGTKLDKLLGDSLVQRYFVDSNYVINILGINSKDTNARIPGIMAGYMKVRYSNNLVDRGLVDKSKMYFGANPNDTSDQSHINPNGILVLPHCLITDYKDTAAIAENIMKYMNDNIDVFHKFNQDGGGSRKNLYLDIYDFGTERLYIPLVIPATTRIVSYELDGKGIPITYITILRYVLYPLDYFMEGLLKKNIDVTIKCKWNNKYMYGDSVTAANLLNKIHGKEIEVSISRGNDFIITFAASKTFKREWSFFPYVYIVLIIISFMFYITLRFFLKQIKQREASLELSNAELKVVNHTKDKFFSIIAHDLRNPIMAMLNVSFIFKDHYHSMTVEEANKSIDILLKATTHLSKMLENLLQWARINIGSIEVNWNKENIDNIVNAAFEDIGIQAENKGIKLIFTNNTTNEVFCDGNMINTILRNLISNAVKFSEKNKTIMVQINDYSEDNKYIVVCVKDEGIGMDIETQNKLFKLDTRTTTSGTAAEKGSGLGLILCKEFIDRHNCKIWVESEIGKGTEFKFTLQKWQDVE